MRLTQTDGITKYSSTFDGTVQDELEKRGFENKQLLTGKKKKRWSNTYENVTVNVTRMTEKNYKKIRLMFRRPYMCELYTDDGDIKYLSFKDERLNLERFENKLTNRFFRRGTINFEE